jgi:Cytochrome c oxidase subunit IV
VRTATKYFLALSMFGLGFGTLYWFLTYEWVGSILLWSLGVTPLVVAGWAARSGAARGAAPGDDASASPRDAAGESLGSFPTATIWPPLLVLAAIVTGASLVYGLLLLPIGLVVGTVAVLGLMRESRG